MAVEKRRRSRTDERKTLLLIIAIVMIPTVGTALVIMTSPAGPDLSDLPAPKTPVDGNRIIDWSSLLRERSHALNFDLMLRSGDKACALGYMNSGDRSYRDGDWVRDFVLLPETGNLLHPAHEFGDQMIAVYSGGNHGVRFVRQGMVFVCGDFGMTPGDPEGRRALYLLTKASVRAAGKSDVARYLGQSPAP